jgi:HK97 family phage prohead protease
MTPRTERAEEVRHVQFRASEDSDGQTLEGYAAVFNEWTDIRDWEGTYRERIAPGAFKKSLRDRTPVLQFEHGSHPLIGSLPLGTLSVAREDRNGLFVRARLSDNWLIQPVRDAIKDKAITGMSFRFRVVADHWEKDDAGDDTRTITEVELLELGPVVFPAYDQTSVAVRSLVGVLDDETRAALAHELTAPDPSAPVDEVRVDSTSPAAGEAAGQVAPVDDDGPAEPPIASREANRTRIAEALASFRRCNPNQETTNVDQ